VSTFSLNHWSLCHLELRNSLVLLLNEKSRNQRYLVLYYLLSFNGVAVYCCEVSNMDARDAI